LDFNRPDDVKTFEELALFPQHRTKLRDVDVADLCRPVW